MARLTKPLTNTEVQQAKPKPKEYSLMDGEGLKLRIKPSGSKLWLFNYYRPHTKKRANLGFGSYPGTSLAEARGKRKSARELLAKDIDPKYHRDQQQLKEQAANSLTLERIAAQWFKIKKTTVIETTATKLWRSLEKNVFPLLGSVPIHKINAPATIDAIRPLANNGKFETVKRVVRRLNEIMAYAVNTGLIDANPLAGIGQAFQTPPVTHMLTLKPEELPELMKILTTASIKITTRCLIEWQLHTLVRPKEAAGTRWDEIDFDNKLWNIPRERMKGRQAKKRPHTVPLTPQALALLEVMKSLNGGREYVFTADRDPTRHAHEQTANMALKRMGFKDRLVAHGLRSIGSTTLNNQGFDGDVVEAALAHIDKNAVRMAYNRADYLERRKPMMKWWSEHIEKAATGNMSLAAGTKTLRAVS